ncbi:MAG: hypothetical protein C0478_03485 [Planctomyces sp.]|nr:hypothetical protein [Planctomyces sp.]
MNALHALDALTAKFPSPTPFFQKAVHLPQSLTPEPYAGLLVHNEHMTVAMENFHHASVNVEVLGRHLEGEILYRKIILRSNETNAVVQFGLVRFDLRTVSSEVREEIMAERTPLGRILINHNLLRHVDLGAILELTLGEELTALMEVPPGTTTYGRLATLFCDHQPAVDLLEVSRPLA